MNSFKLRRLLAELTQKEAAEKLGINQVSVFQWEQGQTMPRADKLPAIAKLYGCTIEELLEKTE